MVDAIFFLLLSALVFLGITAAAVLLFLPFIKFFSRRKKVAQKAEKLEYAEDYAGC